MIVIEEEANCYGCPMSFGSDCIGSSCMAWRWQSIPNPDYKPKHPLDFIEQNPAMMDSPWTLSKTRGYCGMAGSL